MKRLKRFFKVAIVLSFILLTCVGMQSAYASNTSGFLWGVNGHGYKGFPTYPDAYLNQQLDKAAALGVNVYRTSAYVDGNVGGYNFTYMDNLVNQLEARKLIPYIIIDAGLGMDKDSAYAMASAIASRYGSRIPYYQVGNENDLKCQPISGNGDQTTQYDMTDYENIRYKMKAWCDGYHNGYPGAKVVMNVTWTHTGFLKLMDQDSIGIHWDVNALDWYWDMLTGTEVLNKLNDPNQFPNQNEILVAECDRSYGSVQDPNNYTILKEAEQAARIREYCNTMYYNGPSRLKGMFVYELLDRTDSNPANQSEAHYGLVKVATNGDPNTYADKPAYAEYKNAISDIKNTEPVFIDTFDDYAFGGLAGTPWTVTNSGNAGTTAVDISVTPPSNTYNKALYLDDNADTAQTTAYRSFTPQLGIVIAEWKYKESYAGRYVNFRLKSGSNIVTDIYTRYPATPQLSYYNGSTVVDSGYTLQNNKWYTIKVIANTITGKYSIYIKSTGDDETEKLIADGKSFVTTGIASVDGFEMQTNNTSWTNDVYVDYLNISKKMLVNYNFNDYTTGAVPSREWTTLTIPASTACTIQEQPDINDKSIYLNDSSTTNACAVVKAFTPSSATAKLTAEWKFKEAAAGKYPYFRLRDSAGVLITELFVYQYAANDYRLTYKSANGATWLYVPGNYTSNWYAVKVAANPAAKTYDIYVNGTLQVAGAPFRTDNGTFNGTIGQIEFATNTTWTTQVYIDNVKVYQ